MDFNTAKSDTPIMPVVFIGHGSPMNALENNKWTKQWAKLGKKIPKPKAILAISAHWETDGVQVTAMEKPKTIHDFGGFPKALFDMQYPAPGSPELASEIANKLNNFKVKLDKSWGLDHGTWSVLVHMYPKADIPVVQLSLNDRFTPEEHFNFAKNLAWLRRQGVLIFASGNIIHNLRLVDWSSHGKGSPWAQRMQEKSREFIKKHQFAKLVNYKEQGQDFIKAVNSAEHYIPFLYALGLQEQTDKLTIFNDDLEMGALSMTSILLEPQQQQPSQL